MPDQRVKHKFPLRTIPVVLAAATFLASFSAAFPNEWVEQTYSRRVFPTISHIVGAAGDAVPFSWLDVCIVASIALTVYWIRERRWLSIAALFSAAYLWFFWTWGLNYHRVPLEARLNLPMATLTPQDYDDFARFAAGELNRLAPRIPRVPVNREAVASAVAARVRQVALRLEGNDWVAAERIKRSRLAEGWFRIAGVEGMFNPFGHEPLVTSGLLDMEFPFVAAHELAHVRGIPNEGDANLVALLASVTSADSSFQYSGWLQLWFYLRNAERDALLDSGPRVDLESIRVRMRSQQIAWASNLQGAVLDWHLKANDVAEGIQSYARLVTLAIASRGRWEEFR